MFVPVQHLRAQLDHLVGAGWQALDIAGYLAAYARPTGGKSYLFTIDDGFVTTATLAAPELARVGIPSMLFMPSGLVGGRTSWLAEQSDEPLVDADALRQLRGGMHIGAHGLDHTVMTGMSDAELLRQTVDVRDALADLTGEVPRAVERAGCEVAFWRYDDAGRFAVSRPNVKPADSLTASRAKLVPGYRMVWRAAGGVRPLRRGLRVLAQRAR